MTTRTPVASPPLPAGRLSLSRPVPARFPGPAASPDRRQASLPPDAAVTMPPGTAVTMPPGAVTAHTCAAT